jgi:hypothetical protein
MDSIHSCFAGGTQLKIPPQTSYTNWEHVKVLMAGRTLTDVSLNRQRNIQHSKAN